MCVCCECFIQMPNVITYVSFKMDMYGSVVNGLPVVLWCGVHYNKHNIRNANTNIFKSTYICTHMATQTREYCIAHRFGFVKLGKNIMAGGNILAKLVFLKQNT